MSEVEKKNGWMKVAQSKKGKFAKLTIGQLKKMEEEHPELNEGDEGYNVRVYERLGFAYFCMLNNSGVEVTQEQVFDLPQDHVIVSALNETMGPTPSGNGGDSESTEV